MQVMEALNDSSNRDTLIYGKIKSSIREVFCLKLIFLIV